MIKQAIIFIITTLFITQCATYSPPYYSSNNLPFDEVESLFDVDSVVNEIKYFDACIEELNLLPINNWDKINKEGVVGISAKVDEAGELEAAVIFQSVHPTLDSIALESVKNATFKPYTQIINIEGSYVLQMLVPYYRGSFNMDELSILDSYSYDEKMYDIAPEPEVGWEKSYLRVEYKGGANKRRIEGETQITFYIDSQGHVGQFYIAKPFGYGAEEQAIEAILNTKWKPAIKEGQPVPCIVTIPFKFYYYY